LGMLGLEKCDEEIEQVKEKKLMLCNGENL
jgi:hypothetical protein